MIMKNKLIFFICFLIFISSVFSQTIEPKVVSSVEGIVSFSEIGIIEGNLKDGETIEFKILSIPSTENQEVLFREEKLFIGDNIIESVSNEDDNGNRYATFILDKLPVKKFEIIIKAKVRTNYDEPISNSEIVEPSSNVSFIEKTKNVNFEEENIQNAVNLFNEEGFLKLVTKVNNWVHTEIVYDLSYIGKDLTASKTLFEKKGVCDGYSHVAASIFRSKKIPTRLVAGIVHSGSTWDYHAWIQVWNKKLGWVNVDPTYNEAGTINGTHIVFGYFNDLSNSSDFVKYPTGIKVKFLESRSYNEIVGEGFVEIENLETFKSKIIIIPKDVYVSENKAFVVPTKITNQTNSWLMFPISLEVNENFKLNSEKKKLVLIEPFGSIDEKWDLESIGKSNEKQVPFLIDSPYAKSFGKIEFLDSKKVDLLGRKLIIESVKANLGERDLFVIVNLVNGSDEYNEINLNFEGVKSVNETLDPFGKHTFEYRFKLSEFKKLVLIIEDSNEKIAKRIIVQNPPIIEDALENEKTEFKSPFFASPLLLVLSIVFGLLFGLIIWLFINKNKKERGFV